MFLSVTMLFGVLEPAVGSSQQDKYKQGDTAVTGDVQHGNCGQILL